MERGRCQYPDQRSWQIRWEELDGEERTKKSEWRMDDALLIELVKRGHSMRYVPVDVASPDTIVTILKIIASLEHRQYLKVDVSPAVLDGFLGILGLRRTGGGYATDRVVEGVRNVFDLSAPYHGNNMEHVLRYEGARVHLCRMFLSQFLVCPSTIHISNHNLNTE
ncbi:hypothetical protein PENTCL1PPCAC_20577 [Pristionchus entomophagus]|uniref:Uncharacterized protein n=1 Tax=Pristionchus entomophagus TaxID=358040 RepID=A0AAV5TWE2_9BILA|nr:hypothetical protein PENTCL1PPCAC_20577 [Pristionchus entomophagus]